MKKKIYTVGTAHLDTVWNWDFEHTVNTCLKNTLEHNFRLFEKYENYTFNFEGTYRYELMEEYYPKEFQKVREYVEKGRWCVSGSSFENGDVNIPSPEALFRNILYGNDYFDKTFGKRSKDIFLPDCFGFGYALPSIAHHANLLGFSTQKLAWGSAYGIPFDIGKWQGVDGNQIYASFDPHDYTYSFKKIRDWDFVTKKLSENEKYNLNLTSVYHGVGDQGGAVEEKSVVVMENEIAENKNSEIEVLSVSSDQLFKDLDKDKTQELPVWNNELIMKNHAVGGYTSRAIGKRWNRKCEELADMAERACCISMCLGEGEYPTQVLEKAWKRAIAHQFHDDITGTSVQRAYKRSWNDYAVSINQFNSELEGACGKVIQQMNTQNVVGTPIVLFNSIELPRNESVNFEIEVDDLKDISIFDNGIEVPSQLNSYDGKMARISFVANVKPLSFKTFDLRFTKGTIQNDELFVSKNSLENSKYLVKLNGNGEVCSIFDKELNKELLKAPITFDLFKYDGSKNWPAWEMNYREANKASTIHPLFKSVEIVESGNAKVALKVKHEYERSKFSTIISLEKGKAELEFDVEIVWKSLRTLLKNNFSFTATNDEATFDLGLGSIKRKNASEKLFETPAQKWADLTDKSNEFGVSILSECKYGWDKFDENTLRLTLIHTPKRNYRKDSMQSFMDLGLNKFKFAITSHKGSEIKSTQALAREFLQPLVAFETDKHSGKLSHEESFGEISNDGVILRAIKKAQNSDEIVVRFNEGENVDQKGVEFRLFDKILSAKELFASEEFISDAKVENGVLVFDINKFGVKTFALTLSKKVVADNQIKVELPYNRCVTANFGDSNQNISWNKTFKIPSELLQKEIYCNGTKFKLGENSDGALNALIGEGQKIQIQKGFNTVSMLVASLNGDRYFDFGIDEETKSIKINECDEKFAAWDLYNVKESAYVKSGKVACEFTHTITNGKIDTAHQVYFFNIDVDVANAKTLELPNNEDFCLLAATFSDKVKIVQRTILEDQVEKTKIDFEMTFKEKLNYWWYKFTSEMHK